MIKKLLYKYLGLHPNSISFYETFNLTGLPIVTFEQGDQKLNFILDTGSDHNVIDSNILENIKHIQINEKFKLSGLDNVKHEVSCHDITLHYKDIEFTSMFLAKDLKDVSAEVKRQRGVEVHGFLGSLFFNKYKYILDFKHLIAYSKA